VISLTENEEKKNCSKQQFCNKNFSRDPVHIKQHIKHSEKKNKALEMLHSLGDLVNPKQHPGSMLESYTHALH
jgi:hypothetical protein